MKASPESTASRDPLPHVVVGMAMTADGKIASATRSVHTFGSPRDLANLYRIRATADAILCGARTVEETGATLGNGGERWRRERVRRGLAPHPLRVVASGSGTLSPDARIWSAKESPVLVVVSGRARPRAVERLRALGATVWVGGRDEVDWRAVLARLRREHGVRRLVCEGGGELNDALFRAGLVDELRLTICPLILGGRDAPGISGGRGVDRVADAAGFALASVRRAGDEFFLTYRRVARSRR